MITNRFDVAVSNNFDLTAAVRQLDLEEKANRETAKLLEPDLQAIASSHAFDFIGDKNIDSVHKLERAGELLPYFPKKILDDPSVCDFLQEHPILQDKLIQYLKNLKDKDNPSFSHLLLALKSLKRFPLPIQKDKSLLRTLLFIESNRRLMRTGSLGKDAKREQGVKKIKETGLQHAIFYDARTGDVLRLRSYLGKGSCKYVVHKTIDWRTLKVQALGKQRLSTYQFRQVADKEVKLMNRSQGLPHVVQLHSATTYYSHKKHLETQITVTPFYNMGSLEKHMKTLNEKDKLIVAIGIIKGVLNLHSREIIHRDLKPENIFLDSVQGVKGEEIQAIVGDLGISCRMEDYHDRRSYAGTPYYSPPEALSDSYIFAKFSDDDWAVGIILSELFLGLAPYKKINPNIETQEELRSAIGGLKWVTEPADHKSMEFVIWKLTRPDYGRMTLEEALPIIEERLASLAS